MKRSAVIAGLLAAGSSALDLRLRDVSAATATIPGPGPTSAVASFHLVSQEEALSSLSAEAQATPSAVTVLPGVPLSVPGVATASSVTDGPMGTAVPNPLPSSSRVAPEISAAGSCTNPAVAYEWDNLSDEHKQEFTAAIKCLMSKPPRSGLPGVKNRWDDFAAIHQHMNTIIHQVGQFLPWHRYYLWMFYQELSKECQYNGPMTWWDETKNSGDFNGAAPFTDQYFGHMPDGQTVCIISGQFANTELHIGPQSSNTNRCLSRGVNEQSSAQVSTSYVNLCNSHGDFGSMQSCSDSGPHGWGHDAIGGIMKDVQSSPGDPAFFLHHGFINRNWRIWQRTDPGPRTYAIGGYTTQNCGSSCTPTTLGYVLSSYGFYPNVTIDQVMDTEGGFLCYHYDY